jgi:predicted lipid carrier protein YhbT
VVDLVDHEGLLLKRDITLQGVAEEMLTMQCLVGIHYIIASMFSDLSLLTFYPFCLQAFLRSTVLYCYLRKVSAFNDRPEGLRKKLTEAEEESVNLKKVVAKHEEDLRVLGEHSAMMECEASDASKARDRAEAKLLKLSEEVELLHSENAQLREDHRVL